MHLYIYMCAYVHIYFCAYTCLYIDIYMGVHFYKNVLVFMPMLLYVCMFFIYIRIYMNAYICK